jgi:hypothetical protein
MQKVPTRCQFLRSGGKLMSWPYARVAAGLAYGAANASRRAAECRGDIDSRSFPFAQIVPACRFNLVAWDQVVAEARHDSDNTLKVPCRPTGPGAVIRGHCCGHVLACRGQEVPEDSG